MLLTDKGKDRLVEMLNYWVDQCVEKWEKPWACLGWGEMPPMNFTTKKGYNLMNAMMLQTLCGMKEWDVPYFITYNKMLEMGLATKAPYVSGQGEPIVMRTARATDKNIDPDSGMVLEFGNLVIQSYTQFYYKEEGQPIDWSQKPLSWKKYMELTEEERENYIPSKKRTGSWEFNIEQTNFPTMYPDAWEQLKASVKAIKDGDAITHDHKEDVRIEALDKVLNVEGGWRCSITHDGGDSAFYRPSEDGVHLPKPESFFKRSKYYSTALHELAHSTKPALKRDYGSTGFGSVGYATEELVAELTAAFVSQRYNVEVTHDPDNPLDNEHLAYVKGWRAACKDPKKVIGRIFDDIMDAVQYECNYIDYVDDRIEAYRKKKAAKVAA